MKTKSSLNKVSREKACQVTNQMAAKVVREILTVPRV